MNRSCRSLCAVLVWTVVLAGLGTMCPDVTFGGCCTNAVGNADCSIGDGVDVSDLTTLIDHLFIGFAPLCCIGEADCDGSGGIDVSDLTILIDHLFISFSPLPGCLPDTPAPGSIILTEVMMNPEVIADATGEWIEIRNVSAFPVELAGAEFFTATASFTISSSVVIMPGGLATFANSNLPGFVPTYVYGNLPLLNSTGSLGLRYLGVTIDMTNWTTSLSGVAFMRDSDGTWCFNAGELMYSSGDIGTPGFLPTTECQ